VSDQGRLASGGMLHIESTVNGSPVALDVAPSDLLLDVLRERLALTGAKRSCDVQICGTCTVILNGRTVSACTTLAAEMDGGVVRTVEGLADGDDLSPLQEAFVDECAMQCGFCTPGFLMSGTALLEEKPGATAAEASRYLNGNICRCASYNNILAAVCRAAAETGGGSSHG
jgi:aerobic-type carbon monoxide dehydrogenase small subunit (CoxS/CutS family)